jgi:hypothetical protein
MSPASNKSGCILVGWPSTQLGIEESSSVTRGHFRCNALGWGGYVYYLDIKGNLSTTQNSAKQGQPIDSLTAKYRKI